MAEITTRSRPSRRAAPARSPADRSVACSLALAVNTICLLPRSFATAGHVYGNFPGLRSRNAAARARRTRGRTAGWIGDGLAALAHVVDRLQDRFASIVERCFRRLPPATADCRSAPPVEYQQEQRSMMSGSRPIRQRTNARGCQRDLVPTTSSRIERAAADSRVLADVHTRTTRRGRRLLATFCLA